MKAHFVERFTKPGEEISFYRNGKFEDFCRGPHVALDREGKGI